MGQLHWTMMQIKSSNLHIFTLLTAMFYKTWALGCVEHLKTTSIKLNHGYQLQGYDLQSIGGICLYQCSSLCISNMECRSFNYVYDTGQCELKTILTTCQSAHLTIANETSFYGERIDHPMEIGPYDCNVLSDSYSQFIRHNQDLVLSSSNIAVLENIDSLISCASHCFSRGECRSFSFSVNQHQCEIKDTLAGCSQADLSAPISDEVYYHLVEEPCSRSELLLQGLPSSQSTDAYDYDFAHEAIDGDYDTNWYSHSCTHTDHLDNQWWMVDMKKTNCIRQVTIYNRNDCCQERLTGAVIRVGMDPDRNNAECGTGVTSAQINAGAVIDMPCDRCGRYLSVSLPSTNSLTICELYAYVDACSTHTALPSCSAIKHACYSGSSGTYEIDPDGPDNGVDPFTVLCDMNKVVICEAGWPVINRETVDGSGYTLVSPDKQLCNGMVTTWTYQGEYSGPFRAIVFRPVDGSDTQFKIVGINDIPAGAVNVPVVYSVPEYERITVENGDVIGWSHGKGVISLNYGGTTAIRYVGGNLHGGLVTDQIVDINVGEEPREYSIQATVERIEEATTIIGHDSEGDFETPKGYETPGSHIKEIVYEASMPQIEALISVSPHCEQYIKYECYDTAFSYGAAKNVWWVSRDDEDMYNWGSVPTGTTGCTCSVKSGCDTGGICNCVANDHVWRTDEGVLSDKSKLPVMKIHSGDTGNTGEKARFSLSALRCS